MQFKFIRGIRNKIPKVTTWEDVRKEILVKLEREGCLTRHAQGRLDKKKGILKINTEVTDREG